MDKLQINGGIPLEGEVRISGAKNAALPMMCAALLSEQPLRLANVPHLMDTATMAKLLGQLGAGVERAENELVLNSKAISNPALISIGDLSPPCRWAGAVGGGAFQATPGGGEGSSGGGRNAISVWDRTSTSTRAV